MTDQIVLWAVDDVQCVLSASGKRWELRLSQQGVDVRRGVFGHPLFAIEVAREWRLSLTRDVPTMPH